MCFRVVTFHKLVAWRREVGRKNGGKGQQNITEIQRNLDSLFFKGLQRENYVGEEQLQKSIKCVTNTRKQTVKILHFALTPTKIITK